MVSLKRGIVIISTPSGKFEEFVSSCITDSSFGLADSSFAISASAAVASVEASSISLETSSPLSPITASNESTLAD